MFDLLLRKPDLKRTNKHISSSPEERGCDEVLSPVHILTISVKITSYIAKQSYLALGVEPHGANVSTTLALRSIDFI